MMIGAWGCAALSSSSSSTTTATGVIRTARTYIAFTTVDKNRIPTIACTGRAVDALMLCEIARNSQMEVGARSFPRPSKVRMRNYDNFVAIVAQWPRVW